MNRLSTAIALSALSALSASAVALCVAIWSDSRRPPAQDAPRVDVEREAQELRELVASLEDELEQLRETFERESRARSTGLDRPSESRSQTIENEEAIRKLRKRIPELEDAVEARSLEVVRLLLESGANPNPNVPESDLPLHKANQIGSEEIAQLLRDHGAQE